MGLLETREPLGMDTRCIAVGIIGTLSQNNIQVQEDLFKKGVMDKLATVALTNESYVLSAKVSVSSRMSDRIKVLF